MVVQEAPSKPSSRTLRLAQDRLDPGSTNAAGENSNNPCSWILNFARMTKKRKGVGRLYRSQRQLRSVNHRNPRKSATGTRWHASCISIRVHTLSHTGAGRRSFRSRRPPLPFEAELHPAKAAVSWRPDETSCSDWEVRTAPQSAVMPGA